MSVASTKAFYAQVAAGFLLAYAIADGRRTPDRTAAERRALLAGAARPPRRDGGDRSPARPAIAAAAHQLAPAEALLGGRRQRRRPHRRRELRIKLSELCYKSIACDATEDKKHIDLSSEPLILVCAAGLAGLERRRRGQGGGDLPGPQGRADRHRDRGRRALRAPRSQTLTVPAVHPALAFVLCHDGRPPVRLRGRRCHRRAGPCRCARPGRPSRQRVSAPGCRRRRRLLAEPARRLRAAGGRASSTACAAAPTTATSRPAPRCGSLAAALRHRHGPARRATQVEYGRVGTPSVADRGPHRRAHRGASRSSPGRSTRSSTRPRPSPSASPAPTRALLQVAARRSEVLDAGRAARPPQLPRAADARRPRPGGRRRSSATPATAIEGDVAHRRGDDRASSTAAASPGTCRSRTERNPTLRGTKHRVATEREVTVGGRPQRRAHAHIVPEIKGNQCTGLTLLHVRFHDRLPADHARSVLEQYRGRYAALQDAVTETEPTFRDDLLAELPLVDLLTSPVYVLAERWRRRRDRIGAIGAYARRHSRVTVIGVGIDTVEVPGSARSRPARRGSSTGCSPTPSGPTASARKDPDRALRRPLRRQGSGDEGDGRRRGRLQVAGDRGGPARSGQPSVSLSGGAAALAERKGVTGWRLSLSHTATSAEAVAVAL